MRALAGRSETQARDVFDLYHLLSRHPGHGVTLSVDVRRKAHETASSISFEAFTAQVVAYLPAEQQAIYRSADVFEDMHLRCLNLLAGDEA